MKHAYLIMADRNFEQLAILLQCLDNADVDIFLHIDKKSTYDKRLLVKNIKYSNLYFIPSLKVNWGGDSQICAELNLLEYALNTGTYCFYHLLSGSDLPLKNQAEIISFYNKYIGYDFISIGERGSIQGRWFENRCQIYYPFQNFFSRDNLFGKLVRKLCVLVQTKLHVKRQNEDDVFSVGSAYFDISHSFAEYVISNKEKILKKFRYTFCADEIFIQWLWLNWENSKKQLFHFPFDESEFEPIYMDVLRAIDWKRGAPYIWRYTDFEYLMNSNCLFARKFDQRVDWKIVDMIFRAVI